MKPTQKKPQPRRRKKRPILRAAPHANAEGHKEIMKLLRTMTDQEFFDSMVKSGIWTKTGRLAKAYRPGKHEGLNYSHGPNGQYLFPNLGEGTGVSKRTTKKRAKTASR